MKDANKCRKCNLFWEFSVSLQQISIAKFGIYIASFEMYIAKFGMYIAEFGKKKSVNNMANYVIKEMPKGMGNGKKGRLFPKMQVYTEFNYDKVVELVHVNSPAFSQATIRGVLDTLAVVLRSYLPLGHTMKIDNLGVFSLSLEFADNKAEANSLQETQEAGTKTKYHHVKARGLNFKVDKKLVDEINKENDFEYLPSEPASPSPYSIEERLQRALRHIDKYGFISLQEYANLNRLSYSSASRELAKLVLDPHSGIKAKGAGSHKVWIRALQST